MWSSRAEQVVSRLIAELPPELLDPARTHATRLSALPIGVSMWADYYLRPNGDVVIVGEDDDRPDEVTVYTDRVRLLSVLVGGAERYPELRQLVPSRPLDARECVCLQHQEFFGPGNVICQKCGGVGWLPAEHA